ncbi:SDR family oxidoreductase [Arenicella sp. 4NH20-0111]|uniref:SDR family oxidoreductase n=1 Tax=Arenicella sp. 4NH20-0111 TaxID=3127648 RepID=UPI00310858EF
MRQTSHLTGKTALILGASQGIGLASANSLAFYGATVVLAARSIDTIETEATNLANLGFNAFAIPCDVTDYDSVTHAVEFTKEKTGRVDILVNNAGVIDPLTTLIDSDPTQWNRAIDTNLKGVYHGMRSALPIMKDQKAGTIINMSSGAANSALIGWSHYCSSKAAAKKLTEVANLELTGTNIRVIGLSPGTVATPMMAKIRDAGINQVSTLNWDAHLPPQWVGETVAYLCGEGGNEFLGRDFSLKAVEGRNLVKEFSRNGAFRS